MLLLGRSAMDRATSSSDHAAASLGPPGRINIALWLEQTEGRDSVLQGHGQGFVFPDGTVTHAGFATVASDEPQSPRKAWAGASALLRAGLGRAVHAAAGVVYGSILDLLPAPVSGHRLRAVPGRAAGASKAAGGGGGRHRSVLLAAADDEGLVMHEGEVSRVLYPSQTENDKADASTASSD